MNPHPRHDLIPRIQQSLALSLMAAQTGVESMLFKDLRDYMATTDSTLSNHTSALEKLDYVKIKRGFVGKKPQTRLSLNNAGLNT